MYIYGLISVFEAQSCFDTYKINVCYCKYGEEKFTVIKSIGPFSNNKMYNILIENIKIDITEEEHIIVRFEVFRYSQEFYGFTPRIYNYVQDFSIIKDNINIGANEINNNRFGITIYVCD